MKHIRLFAAATLIAVAFSQEAISQTTPIYLDETADIDSRIEDALARMTLDDKIALVHAQSKFSTPGCPRLGIPEIWMSDGPHGVRMEFTWDDWVHSDWTNDSCTALPALTCLAATFDPELAREYGNVVGREARFRKKDIILGPGVNIYRTPLSGRNFEYMGEDPYLASKMVVPYIQGLQQNGVAACLKHFALNNQEHNRDNINVNVDERALNEIYLPAFKAGVTEGGVWAVMGAYNKYQNTFCTHNDTLVNKILKGQWGFDGVMITDWGSAHDTREAALNGLDIEMGSWTNGLTWGVSSAYDNYYMAQPLKKLIKDGEIDESVLDDKVRRIMRLCYRTNMNRQRPYGAMRTDEHADVALRVAREGIVLLKNDRKALPIAPGRYGKIAVIGENAVKCLTIGGGSSELKPYIEISPLQGLKDRYGDAVNFTLGYASGEPNYSFELPSPYDADSLRAEALSLARESDVVIFVGGLNKNFTQDCEGDDRRSYELPFGQSLLIEDLAAVNPNLHVVLLGGNGVAMPWIDKAKSVTMAWFGGSFAGVAIADVLSGEVNPSGKLPFSIPVNLADNCAHFHGEEAYPGIDGQVYYKEGILVGYRWHDTKQIPARFPFGHGLSYTTFAYSDVHTDKTEYLPDENIVVTLKVKNTGKQSGAESVQVYAGQNNPKLLRPIKELKGFARVDVDPGMTRTVTVTIPARSLAYFDDNVHSWKLDNDTYTISVGSSSKDIRKEIKVRINDNLAINE